MDPWAFLRAAGVGIAIAAPVGPMSVLYMRRTLTLGWRFGAATGLGIATGDGVYASVAALGLASISHFMLAHDRPLHLAAGLFLLYLGARAFGRPTAEPRSTTQPVRSLTACYGGAFLLTLTNPPTIVSFAAIFAALSPRTGLDVGLATVTVAGVFTGSILWWLVLGVVVTALRHALGTHARRLVDRLSATLLAIFGIAEIRRSL